MDIALNGKEVRWSAKCYASVSVDVNCNGLQCAKLGVSYVKGLDSAYVWLAVYPHRDRMGRSNSSFCDYCMYMPPMPPSKVLAGGSRHFPEYIIY